MLAGQNFESYPKLGGDGVRQSTNYALGGGGTSTTRQFRPTSGTQPVLKKQQITQPGQGEPQVNVVKPPPPGVATQAPSPSVPRPSINVSGMPAAQPFKLPENTPYPVTRKDMNGDGVPDTGPGTGDVNAGTTGMAQFNPSWMTPGQQAGTQLGGATRLPGGGPRPVIKPALPAGGGSPGVRPISGGIMTEAIDMLRPPPQQGGASTQFNGSGTPGAPTKFNVEDLIAQLVGNPGQSRRQGMQDMFKRLTGEMGTQVNEDAARRGLDFTSVPTDILGRQTGELAGRMTEQEGLNSAEDFRNAVSMAQNFGQQGIDNSFRGRGMDLDEELGRGGLDLQRELGRGDLDLSRDRFGLDQELGRRGMSLSELNSNRDWQQTGFTNDLGLRDQDLEETLAGHGMSQDDFGNQMTTRNQRLRELQTLMGIGDYSQAPLNTAVGAGFDYSGATGEQAAGSADWASQFAELLPFFGGGGGGGAPGGTPPFNPTPATFGGNQGGTYGIRSGGRRY